MSDVLAVCASHAPGINLPGQEQSGPAFRQALVTTAELVADFDPDVVVLFGADHRRAFREIIPTFLAVWNATGLGDYGSPTGSFLIPQDTVRELTDEVVEAGFDLGVGTGLVLDHGFCQTADQMLGGLDVRPIIPVFINCATAPLPSAARTIALGRRIGEFFAERDERVLYLASGGLSHTPPSLDAQTRLLSDERRWELVAENSEASREMVYPNWDKTLLDALAGTPEDVVATVTDEFLVAGGTGAHEVRNWLAAWAAAGQAPLGTIVYEEVVDWFTGMGIAATASVMKTS